MKVEKYPLSEIQDILATLEGVLYFTNVNLNQIYLQLTIDEEPQELLKINTPKILLHCVTLCIGLLRSSDIFQERLNKY